MSGVERSWLHWYSKTIYDNYLLVKQTETSKKLLAGEPLEYPYEGSKTLMFLVSEFENPELMKELLEGMYKELK